MTPDPMPSLTHNPIESRQRSDSRKQPGCVFENHFRSRRRHRQNVSRSWLLVLSFGLAGLLFGNDSRSIQGNDKRTALSSTFVGLSNVFASAEETKDKRRDYLNNESVVLITGAAGFIGSELAIALHNTYNVKKPICIDSMNSGLGPSAVSARTEEEWTEKLARDGSLKDRTEEELSLFEFKRQRAFHVLQTTGPKAHFYRSDFRPSIPEYFDVGEVPLLDTIFKSHPDITHVVHLADFYHGAVFDKNAQGVGLTHAVPRVKEQIKSGMIEAIFEQLKKSGDERGVNAIPHFTFASSFEVYNHLVSTKAENNPNPPPFREERPITSPSSLRGASKLIDEITANTYHKFHGIFSIGLRFFPVYGPWGLPGSPIFEMAELAVSDADSSILLSSKDVGGQTHADVRDYVYIDDAVDAIMAAMQYRSEGERSPPLVVNIGTGTGSTLGDVATQMERYFPRSKATITASAEINRRQQDNTDSSPTVSYAATDRAEALLGFKARVSLSHGIVKLLSWHYDRAFPYGGRPKLGDVLHEKDEKPAYDADHSDPVKLSGIRSCLAFDKECLRGVAVFPCASECSHEGQCSPTMFDDVVRMSRTISSTCPAVMYTVALGSDISHIPSATMALSPDSHSSVNFDPNSLDRRCNIAFLSERSSLVQNLKRDRGIPLSVSVVEEFMKEANENSNPASFLLTHGFWTLIPVSTPSMQTADFHILRMLPKLSPGFFFSGNTKHAIYCDVDVLFSDVPALLQMVQLQPKKDGSAGATAMMMADALTEYVNPNLLPFKRPKTLISPGRRWNAPDTSQAKALQERAYNMIRVGLRGELPGGGAKALTDSSWIVHRLGVEDARLLRCDMYGEVVQWNVGSDERAMEFVMGLHDLWSRVLIQWNNDRPWWTNDQGNRVTVIPEVVSRKSEFENVALENDISTDSDANARKHINEGTWMGILSSTSDVHYFVHIVPPSAVGAIRSNDYSY